MTYRPSWSSLETLKILPFRPFSRSFSWPSLISNYCVYLDIFYKNNYIDYSNHHHDHPNHLDQFKSFWIYWKSLSFDYILKFINCFCNWSWDTRISWQFRWFLPSGSFWPYWSVRPFWSVQSFWLTIPLWSFHHPSVIDNISYYLSSKHF